jgi:long-chain acyl-CoA synthetase
MSGLTLPALLRDKARKYENGKVAIREKEFGIWQSLTWRDYYENVKQLGLGLVSLGYQKGDKLSIIGDNRPEWLFAELAAQSLGGASVGIYPDNTSEQVQYIIDHSDSTFVVVEDQEQADKILEIKGRCPKLKRVIVDDMKGMRSYHDPLLMPLKEIQRLGKELEGREPKLFPALLEEVGEEDVAIIAYTSGTTGLPKGAMLSHKNMISMARNYDSIDPAFESDEFVSFLPLPWVGEQMTCVSWHLWKGFTVNFPERVETVQENIREVGPHIMFAPPRIWEKMCSEVQVKIQDASWPKRWIYRLASPVGYQLAEFKVQKKAPGFWLRLGGWIAYWLLFRSLKNYLGMARLRNVYTGGAALGPEIFKMFQALGVNIKQLYGQTEISGISVAHRNNDIKLETVGQPIPETEILISNSGEILSRGPSVFLGYYKNPEATAEALRDGWLHSGDAGWIDEDGHLVMLDRMKDVMKLSDGSKFSPQLIENKLKFSPYISEAVVIGQDRPFLTAMINMDMANVGKWAENHQIAYTTFTDLSQKDEVYQLISDEVARINGDLPRVAQIRRFVLLYKELDADDEELTRTRKVRRSFISERYQHLIQALYGERETVEVEAEIKYRDGREFRMKTKVKVKFVVQGKRV